MSIMMRNGDPLRDKNIHFQECEILLFKYTDFLKPANISLYASDVAAEIMRPYFIDFRTDPWITKPDDSKTRMS